jgi:hypothetical protein
VATSFVLFAGIAEPNDERIVGSASPLVSLRATEQRHGS